MAKSDRIKELIDHLTSLGYVSEQVKEVIFETVDAANLEDISVDEEWEILEYLESEIKFALKCRKAKAYFN